MITENYVDFKIAKLLKEKGFDEPTMHFFNADGTKRKFQQAHYPEDIAQPTLQTAMKWLREVHEIVIVIEPYDSYEKERYEFTIYKRHDNDTFEWDMIDVLNSLFVGYEKCAESAIDYCLRNLI